MWDAVHRVLHEKIEEQRGHTVEDQAHNMGLLKPGGLWLFN